MQLVAVRVARPAWLLQVNEVRAVLLMFRDVKALPACVQVREFSLEHADTSKPVSKSFAQVRLVRLLQPEMFKDVKGLLPQLIVERLVQPETFSVVRLSL